MNTLSIICTGASYVLRGYNAVKNSAKILEDVSKYDHTQWSGENYLDVAFKTTEVVAETISLTAAIGSAFATKEIKALNATEHPDASIIKELKKTAKSYKQTSIASGFISGACSIANECNHGRSIYEILVDPKTLVRLGALTKECGEIAQLQDQGKWDSKCRNIGNLIQCIAFLKMISSDSQPQHQYANVVAPQNPNINISAPQNQNYQSIPDLHHGDATFSTFVCPITLCPCRYPVLIGKQYYEYSAIVAWQNLGNQYDPMRVVDISNLLLTVDPQALTQIENRMTQLGIPL